MNFTFTDLKESFGRLENRFTYNSFYLVDISATEPYYIGKIIVLSGEKIYVYKIKPNGTIDCTKKSKSNLKESIEHWILNLPISVHWYKMALLKHEIITAKYLS